MYLLRLLELAVLAGLTVSLWTVRVALTARRRRYAGALVATAEALVFATVFARVIESVDSPSQLAAYGVGVGIGTLAGLAIDERGVLVGCRQGDSPDADRQDERGVVRIDHGEAPDAVAGIEGALRCSEATCFTDRKLGGASPLATEIGEQRRRSTDFSQSEALHAPSLAVSSGSISTEPAPRTTLLGRTDSVVVSRSVTGR